MNYKIAPTYYTRLLRVLEQVQPGERLLNAGCGTGEFSYYLRDRFSVNHGIDINEADITTAKEVCPDPAIEFRVGDITALDVEDDFYDAIICVDVLEHVDHPDRVLAELNRVLKPGGQLVVTIPHSNYPVGYDPVNFIRERISGKHFPIGIWGFGHTKLFSRTQMIELIQDAGFTVTHSELMTHSLCGLMETYIPTVLQPLFKSNSGNTAEAAAGQRKEQFWHFSYDIPEFFAALLRPVIALDRQLGKNSKHGVGVLVKATIQTDS